MYGDIELEDLTGDGQDVILVKFTDVGSNYGVVDTYVYIVKKSELIEILCLKSDLAGFTPGLCRQARNEIYARHERRFQDKELQRYFEWHT